MKMRILLTGGLGCIGSQIAESFLHGNHTVTIIDACESERNVFTANKLIAKGCIVEKRRIEDNDGRAIIDHLVRRCDVIIHAAASTGIPYSAVHPVDDWASNAEATRVLLEAIRLYPRPTVILSSVKPYRVDSPNELRLRGGLGEDDRLDPDEPYAASKAAQSMLAVAYARSYDLPIVTLRCSNLYGTAPCHGPRHGWLTWFCISAAIGRPIEIQGTGDQARDMLFGTDVAAACRVSLANARQLAGKIFNIGGGVANVISINQAYAALQKISAHYGSEVKCIVGPSRKYEDQLVFVNYCAFHAATGWYPCVPVNDGIRRTYEWARENVDELQKIYAEKF